MFISSEWLRNLELILKLKHGTYLPDFRRRCTLLSIYYLFISSEVRFRFAGPERQWDAELPNFSWILNLAEIIIEGESSIFARGVNSHELGLTMPLLQVYSFDYDIFSGIC